MKNILVVCTGNVCRSPTGEYLLKKEDGTAIEINNSPNVTIKAESLRDILSLVFDAGADGKDKFATINEMITRIEREGF